MAKKVVYLTIDDAPSQHFLQKVDFLLRNNLPAVFFCRGDYMEERPREMIEAIHKGFIIGNHSYDHPHFSDLTLEEAFAQIEKTEKILEDIYKAAKVSQPAKIFRFPYGDKGGLNGGQALEPYIGLGLERKNALQDFLQRSGYIQPDFSAVTYNYYHQANLHQDLDWFWTFDLVEWSVYAPKHLYGIDSLEKIYARIETHDPENGCGLHYPDSADIILTHDHLESTEIFYPIIQRLLQKNFDFQLPKL
jgi:peptidoglycan-N-acetylglucosamine deacetylase